MSEDLIVAIWNAAIIGFNWSQSLVFVLFPDTRFYDIEAL